MKHLRPKLALVAAWAALASPLRALPKAVPYTPPTQPTPLGSTFVAWDSLTARYTPVGLSRSVFDSPTATLVKFELHVTTLRPGMPSHAPHHHPWEEMILIKEGNVEVSINGRKHPAGPGALIFFASHDVHNLVNVGPGPATYYVVNFCPDSIFSVRDQAAADWAPPGRLPSSVIDCDRLPATPTRTGFRRQVVDSPTLTFLRLQSHITGLGPGQTTPRDRDAADELYLVKSGRIEATVDGVACRLGAGSLFFVASAADRSVRNIGATTAVYQVIKVVTDKTPTKPAEP